MVRAGLRSIKVARSVEVDRICNDLDSSERNLRSVLKFIYNLFLLYKKDIQAYRDRIEPFDLQ